MEKATQVRDALTVAQDAFEENRIWLTESCAKSVDALVTELRSAYNQLAVWLKHEKGLTDEAEEQKARAWMRSWEAVSAAKVPPARQALEAEMRLLLDPQRSRPVPIGISKQD
jgi:hypothetical protein